MYHIGHIPRYEVEIASSFGNTCLASKRVKLVVRRFKVVTPAVSPASDAYPAPSGATPD